jgi:hypothetical protein
MQKKVYELSIVDLKRLKKDIIEIGDILKSKEFLEFIAKKCVEKVKEISSTKLSAGALENNDVTAYMQSHNYSIRGDTITLYNDSQIDVASKSWMSEETLANYNAQLSLGKIIEFGIGYTGGLGSYDYVDSDWHYDVNEHGYKGWYYEDKAGNLVWTNGFAGKQIYAELMNYLDNHLNEWIDEYFNKKL